jgi:hypothetical protein
MAVSPPPPPSREDFEQHWVRATVVLNMFEAVSHGYAALELHRRLCGGRLLAAGTNQHDDLHIIRSEGWEKANAANIQNALWWTGRVAFELYIPGRSFVVFEYFGVRFDPVGLQRLADDIGLDLAITSNRQLAKALTDYVAQPVRPSPQTPATTSADIQRQRKRANPVTVQEIETWHETLSEADRSLGVTALWAKAKTDHPGRHLPRKLVEPFGKGRSNGHRPSRA